MQLKLMTLFIGLTSFLMGCGSHIGAPPISQSSSPRNHEGANQEDSESALAWSLTYTSKCDGQTPEKCQGGFGFTATSDGIFEVGPGPDGQKLEGDLPDFELKEIKNKAKELAGATRIRNTETCIPLRQETSEYSIRFTLNKGDPAEIHAKKFELCFNQTSKKHALFFSEVAKDLVKKYHPPAFPSPCINAASSINHVHDKLRYCETDDDCSYFDENYNPISTDELLSRTWDECQYIQPVFVANHFSVISHQRELIEQRDTARGSCSPDEKRPACNPNKKLKFEKRHAACVKNVCQAHHYPKNNKSNH